MYVIPASLAPLGVAYAWLLCGFSSMGGSAWVSRISIGASTWAGRQTKQRIETMF